MSNWNTDYKYKNSNYYSGYKYDNRSRWAYGIVLGSFISIFVYFILAEIAKTYGWPKVIGWVLFGSMIGLIVGTFAISILYAIHDWWSGLNFNTDIQKTAQTAYNTPKNTIIVGDRGKTTTLTEKVTRTVKINGLLAGERDTPPRAAFFGRVDGVEVSKQGPLEEKWLNYFELQAWEKQKRLNHTLSSDIASEIDDDALEVANEITKIQI